MKILVINGVNLNTLGTRERSKYGSFTLKQLEKSISERAESLGVDVEFYQSNIEGEIVNRIHSARGQADGIIINAGAFTHYSIAIRDALLAAEVRFIEVHITNVYAREEFRHKSVLSDIAAGCIVGLGANGYLLALQALADEKIN